MAELHRVEINEQAPNEIEPDKQPSAEVEEPKVEQERPEWLPEKFESAEAMARAYGELEKKMGAGANQQTQEEELTDEGDVQNDNNDNATDNQENGNYNEAVVEASQEFFANDGQLSEETYKKLEEVGLPRDLVDSYAAGQQALLQSEEGEIKSIANGQFDAMADWANDNLTEEEIDAFDDIVTTGSKEQAKFAVKSLYERYTQANGTSPKLVQGAVNGSSVMPFRSMQELTRAQSDPRYKNNDKAYHEEIDRRLSVSKDF